MGSTLDEDVRALDFVVLGDEKTQVVFVPETLQLFRVNDRVAGLLREARAGTPVAALAERRGLAPAEVERLLGRITAAVRAAEPVAVDRTPGLPEAFGPVLPKLVLMVNNYCNLKCTYCYEHKTVFDKKALDMSPLVVRTALEKFHAAFEGVRELMFIGGEPTLSEDVLEQACATASRLALERGRTPPAFSMITNGARMSERLFALVRTYAIQVTFSLDGPPAVQDLVRLRHDDTGSYAEVARNVKRYAADFPDKLGLECTVSRTQQAAGVTVGQLVDFFAEEFGVEEPHVAPAGLAPGAALNPYDGDAYLQREFREAADASMQNLLQVLAGDGPAGSAKGRLDMVASMLRTLLRRRASSDMCPAGTAQLVVDAFGDVYPCWMFAGMDGFRMGNVLRDEIFNDLAMKVLARIHGNTKKTNPQCSACYARYACNACIGNNENATGRMEVVDERFCETVRGGLTTVLLRLAEAQQDAALWGRIQKTAARARKEKDERVRK